MAAATVTAREGFQLGHKRGVFASFTAPANNDTWVSGLARIDTVLFGFPGGNLAAADSVSYTKSGGTVTFKVVGTARDLEVLVIGL